MKINKIDFAYGLGVFSGATVLTLFFEITFVAPTKEIQLYGILITSFVALGVGAFSSYLIKNWYEKEVPMFGDKI